MIWFDFQNQEVEWFYPTLPGAGAEEHGVAYVQWQILLHGIGTCSNKTVPSVTWLFHAFSSWLQSLKTNWFLGTWNIIGLLIHVNLLFLTLIFRLDVTHLRRHQNITLQGLRIIVNNFAADINEARVGKIAAHSKKRAELC